MGFSLDPSPLPASAVLVIPWCCCIENPFQISSNQIKRRRFPLDQRVKSWSRVSVERFTEVHHFSHLNVVGPKVDQLHRPEMPVCRADAARIECTSTTNDILQPAQLSAFPVQLIDGDCHMDVAAYSQRGTHFRPACSLSGVMS